MKQKGKNEIDGIQNLDSLQNSIAFSLKRKVKEKRMVRKKETKEEELQIKLYGT